MVQEFFPDFSAMHAAIEEAIAAGRRDEVPIGAVIIDPKNRNIVARAGNRTREQNDPTAHAEMLALRSACQIAGAQRIPELHLYVTLEPCAMCAAALSFARIERIVYGAPDPKGGGIDHGGKFYTQPTCHHRPFVTGNVLAEPCGQLLKDFFTIRR